MEKLFLMLLTSMLFLVQKVTAQTPKPDESEQIRQTITQFVKGGDARDVASLDHILHPDFRVVLNNAFGSNKIDIISKDAYLSMMKEGRIGGTPRSIEVLSLETADNVAIAKVKLESEKLRFISLFSLVRTSDSQWQLIHDMPHVEAK